MKILEWIVDNWETVGTGLILLSTLVSRLFKGKEAEGVAHAIKAVADCVGVRPADGSQPHLAVTVKGKTIGVNLPLIPSSKPKVEVEPLPEVKP